VNHSRNSGDRSRALDRLAHSAGGFPILGTRQPLSENRAFQRDDGLAVVERTRDARQDANE
jgi:hypothetical protein